MRDRKKPNMGRWFWGTILALVAVTVVLNVVAFNRSRDAMEENQQQFGEWSPPRVQDVLSRANSTTLRKVSLLVAPLLEEAYAPVHAAVPEYAEFHYSVWGSYVELGTAVSGDPAVKLQQMLFSGMEGRLSGVANKLNEGFSQVYREELAAEVNSAEENDVTAGTLTAAVFDDAIEQTGKTAIALSVGGGSTKVVALAISKKMGTKIAAKAAAKAGAKWSASAMGGGGAAAACGWLGPGAAVCAVGGAAVAWLVTDAGAGKLDELWNREAFEAELHHLIEVDKAAKQALFVSLLAERALQVQVYSDRKVQKFTLRQLSGGDWSAACGVASELIARYDELAGNIHGRTPTNISALKAELESGAERISLDRLVREIRENLTGHASYAKLQQVRIIGNLPLGYRANRKVSARLEVNGYEKAISRAVATEEEGFSLVAEPGGARLDMINLSVSIDLEQHLRIRTNRRFQGEVALNALGETRGVDGLLAHLTLEVPVSLVKDGNGMANASSSRQDQVSVNLELLVEGDRLPELEFVPDCAEKS
ncbi:hypothetical protein R3X27_03590 [Tropicimonas sp. TH_r6]|nr:hypothetical protein [Tropicimonas sp. TH_r6]